MNLLASPNLPKGKVLSVLIGSSAGKEMIEKIAGKGTEIIKCGPDERLPFPVRSHPDMRFHHASEKTIFFFPGIRDTVQARLAGIGFNCREIPERPGNSYPADVRLNAARIGKYVICNPNIISRDLLGVYHELNLIIIPVKQGYARCSVCPVDEHSIITADIGIADAAKRLGFDVLRIRPGYIKLDGYPYGFIGGASGKLSDRILCFTGKVEAHPDYESIRAFCERRGVHTVSLSDEELTDIGGIVPLTEE